MWLVRDFIEQRVGRRKLGWLGRQIGMDKRLDKELAKLEKEPGTFPHEAIYKIADYFDADVYHLIWLAMGDLGYTLPPPGQAPSEMEVRIRRLDEDDTAALDEQLLIIERRAKGRRPVSGRAGSRSARSAGRRGASAPR